LIKQNIKSNVPHNASVFAYSGGKSHIAPWIVDQFPSHKRYLEPFCGSLAVFFHKAPCQFEIVNDLNREVANFFQIVRDNIDELTMQLLFTPVSREEFVIALQEANNLSLVERARAFFILQNQGFSGSGSVQGDWVISNSSARGVARQVSSWQTNIALLAGASQRLRNTLIENRDAIEVIRHVEALNDVEQTLIYCDPPYVHSTRKDSNLYANEMTNKQHETLLQVAIQSQAMWAISGYANEMYRDYLTGWRCNTKDVPLHSSGRVGKLKGKAADRRIECLWLNPLAVQKTQSQLWK